MSVPIKILALCATYNRCEITLAALKSLQNQKLPFSAMMQIAVVDDASPDGTLNAIQNELPNVFSISSNGGLYWAGAMRFGFSHFWKPEIYTHLLVFNDDCLFYPNALNKLLDITKHLSEKSINDIVVVASLRDKLSGALTYGGMRCKKWRPAVYFDRVMPTDKVQIVDTLNMNLALISKECLMHNTFIEDYYTHSLADFDFGLRVSKNGTKIYLAPGFFGECSRNITHGTWEDVALPFYKRWSLIRQPKGLPFLPRVNYLRSHVPFIWPLIFIWPYLKLFVLHVINRIRTNKFATPQK